MNYRLLGVFGLPLMLFACLQIGVVYLASVMFQAAGATDDPTATLLSITLLTYVVAGFVAGCLSPQRQLSHALVVGALCALTAVVGFGASPGSVTGQLVLCAMGALLAFIGALPTKLFRRRPQT